ncbi:hypothetical protein [Methylorubrum sp. SB2]|uniref:hypothetical protein n=1 Tax=Methylorubrum subtropicum TaxID=3138812 RepID=UPI00313BF9ED
MARSKNSLVDDLLGVAVALTEQGGRASLRKASLRRAVSTAYYAVFHALCFVCANELVGWRKANDLIEPVYRMLDHGTAKNRLIGKDAAAISPAIRQIGTGFRDLQEARHEADYRTPALNLSRDSTLQLIAEAREVVDLIEALPPEDRLKLAILLVTKAR